MDNYNLIYSTLNNLNNILTDKEIKQLQNMGIQNLHDLFYYFPKGYDDRTNILKIGDLRGEEYVVLKANILNVVAPPTKTGLKMVKATVTDGSGILDIVWFQMPYLRKTLKPGEEYIFIGQVKRGYRFQMINPEFKLSSSQRKMSDGEILPIYNTGKALPQNTFRKIINKLIKKYIPIFFENIPTELISQYKIMGRREALMHIHFPNNNKNLEDAKRRFAIEELLILELGIIQKKFESIYSSEGRYSLPDNKELVSKYLHSLSFSLTNAQKKVITEIYKDLNRGKIVNRLIQGDVGSGKTVVSIVLLLYMLANSYQGALMAPTEILAEQHYLSIKEKFNQLGIRVELLTGSFTGKRKQQLIENIKNGDVGIVIGTHALIEENVVFKKLGMIIIDEQHRFGVLQRKKLRDKGVLANLIVMSATPIPRSLALTIYGDLDVSVIDELPPGRKPIKTKWISSNAELKTMYTFIDKKLQQGRQAYFIAPLIEDSEKLSAKSVEQLKIEVETYLPTYKIGVLHGKLKNSEKNQVMQEFKNGTFDILVATTVVEVGVDVPNSTIIVINDAHRFGLSALHQLRGRVGRGQYQSYCFLVSHTENNTSKARLQIMEQTEDGFKIAEEDLRLRNPGEIFGTKQSGLSDLKFTDIIHDVKTIKFAKDIATNYLKKHKGVISNEYMQIDIAEKFKQS